MDETQAIALAFEWYDSGNEDPDEFKEMIRVLFRSAVTTEREACASVCLEIAEDGAGMAGEVWAERCCTAIRKRSND